ncbi:MATE family efflux transporter [Noviherbaspirillum sp.]|jgi:putative MATE family efflux protein|uniref:MATE family efflux transporter n=1 Tax=Noviherbaspirillum sp. TaxID=1926288 RepID=UPI0025CB9A59|nr:MATE family efflux transporter [Noviherbaspirillum sp.]
MTELTNQDAAPLAESISLGMQDRLLRGPVVPTMLSLATPATVVMVIQILVSLAETYFLGFLGTDALAGVTLVFPVLTFMQMISNGDIGGGVASAVARALGAGRREDANMVLMQGLLLAIVFGAACTAAEMVGGRALYVMLGGTDAGLLAALSYSRVIFAGAVLIWIVSILAAALRGAGDMAVPALVTVAAALVVIPLSPALIFGWWIFPRLGVAGAAAAVVIYYFSAAIALIAYLHSPKSPLRLRFGGMNWLLLKDVLRIGGASAIRTSQSNLAIVLITGLVGLFGTKALAGYGIASRLDFLLIPLLFGLGTAVLSMVGANVGAGQYERANRIGWLGALAGALATGVIGIAAAAVPNAWLGLFSNDPEVLRTGASYLKTVAPFYGLFGFGIVAFFAGQGIARVGWPFLAASGRLALVAFAVWFFVKTPGSGTSALWLVVGVSYLVFGGISAFGLRPAGWKPGQAH